MEEFEEIFEDLEDPRTGNAKRHELHEILVIWFCPLLSGGETCADMALFGRSKLEFLHDTFSRVFRLLDTDCFHTWFIGFMKHFAEACQGVVAIDGKTLRRSFDRASAASPLHLVSAWAADQRLVLGQLAVGDKELFCHGTMLPSLPQNEIGTSDLDPFRSSILGPWSPL